MIIKEGRSALYGAYPKYNRLNDICRCIFPVYPQNITLYIDLTSLYKILYSNYATTPIDIAASTLNMIAHYRRYFKTANINTKFMFIYSNMSDESYKLFVPDMYNDWNYKLMYNKETTENINKAIDLIDKVIHYIPDSSLTITSVEPSTIIYNYIGNESSFLYNNNEGDYNFIISKDLIMPFLDILPRTVVLRPSKNKEEDLTQFIMYNGVYENLCARRKLKYNDEYSILNIGLYSFILASVGDKDRSLKSLVSLPSLVKELIKLFHTISFKYINAYTANIFELVNSMGDNVKYSLISGNIEGRFNAIDPVVNMIKYSTQNPERLILPTGFKNLYDPKGLHDLDSEFFSAHHLYLESM